MRSEEVELTNICCLYRKSTNEVLVENRLDSTWKGLAFPGGHLEKEEALTDSMVREFKEETGLTLLDPVLKGVKCWYNQGIRHMVFVYLATKYEGTLQSSSEGECFFMKLDDFFVSNNLAPTLKEELDLYFNPECFEADLKEENHQYKTKLFYTKGKNKVMYENN
jgi:8-oxo-dGTP diphosphatase